MRLLLDGSGMIVYSAGAVYAGGSYPPWASHLPPSGRDSFAGLGLGSPFGRSNASRRTTEPTGKTLPLPLPAALHKSGGASPRPTPMFHVKHTFYFVFGGFNDEQFPF